MTRNTGENDASDLGAHIAVRRECTDTTSKARCSRLRTRLFALPIAAAAIATPYFAGCAGNRDAKTTAAPTASLKELMQARGLTEADVTAALKTYVPTGKFDEYLIFASGGQSG